MTNKVSNSAMARLVILAGLMTFVGFCVAVFGATPHSIGVGFVFMLVALAIVVYIMGE